MASTPLLEDLLPQQAKPVDDGIRREAWLAALFGGGFFGGFMLWAALTPLDAGAYARGVVEVAGNRQSVQHREGGIVTGLQAAEGNLVRKGQPLVRIASGDVEAEERGLAAEYYMLLAQRARLTAEQSGAGSMSPPAEFAGLAGEDLVLAEQALKAQQSFLRVRRSSLAAQKSVLGQRSAQAGAQIGGVGQQQWANREQRRLIEDELQGLRSLAERGFVTKTRLRMLEREAAKLNGDYGSQTAQIAQTKELVGEQTMQAAVLDRNLLKEVDADLRDAAQRINELQPRLAAARERLARTVVRAPASGRVVGLTVFTVGGVVAPGQTLMEIIPQDRELIIKAQILPDDIDDVRAGMSTDVRFPSIREAGTPTVTGRLATVSADSLADQRSGNLYFSGEVRVDAGELGKIARDTSTGVSIRPGLPAEIFIPLSKRTVLQYLLEPLTRALWRTGREH